MKNKMSGLLMEVGAVYDKKRLHGKKYFNALLERVEDVPRLLHYTCTIGVSGIMVITIRTRHLPYYFFNVERNLHYSFQTGGSCEEITSSCQGVRFPPVISEKPRNSSF
jgi:hypothetical protein